MTDESRRAGILAEDRTQLNALGTLPGQDASVPTRAAPRCARVTLHVAALGRADGPVDFLGTIIVGIRIVHERVAGLAARAGRVRGEQIAFFEHRWRGKLGAGLFHVLGANRGGASRTEVLAWESTIVARRHAAVGDGRAAPKSAISPGSLRRGGVDLTPASWQERQYEQDCPQAVHRRLKNSRVAGRRHPGTWYKTGAMHGLLFLVLMTLIGCGRTEEPASAQRTSPRAAATGRAGPPPSRPAESRGGDQAAASGAATRCIVQLPAQLPAKAQPAQHCPEDPKPGASRLPTASAVFATTPGQPEVSVELAQEPAARQRGLMYRTELAPDAGMLFSWPDERIRSFWMSNTCIPLDMLFIATDGTIVGILEQVPVLNESSRSIPCPARHVLEVNAGWARAHQVRPGHTVKIRREP
jgi:uncharacterized membrane protein (UPF0127 family)